jgi:hypothetical protein
VRFGRRPNGPQAQGHEFPDFVRQALHAAADQVEPHVDGLERIRARIVSGPAHAQAPVTARGGFLAGLLHRRSHPGGHARRTPRSARQWQVAVLRPAFAAGFAVFALGVALAVPPVRAAIGDLSSSMSNAITGQNSRSGGGTGTTEGEGQSAGGGSGAVTGSPGARASAVASCRPTGGADHPKATTSPAATATTTPPTTSPATVTTSPATDATTPASPSDTATGGSPSDTATSPSDTPTQTVSPNPDPDPSPSLTTTSPAASGTANAKRTSTAAPSPSPCATSARPEGTGTPSGKAGKTTSPSPASPSPTPTPDASPSPTVSPSPTDAGNGGTEVSTPGAQSSQSADGTVKVCKLLHDCKKK